jgi:hypothetical protein
VAAPDDRHRLHANPAALRGIPGQGKFAHTGKPFIEFLLQSQAALPLT